MEPNKQNYDINSNSNGDGSDVTLQGLDEVTAAPDSFKPKSLFEQSVITPKQHTSLI